jgi:hypothetical protein
MFAIESWESLGHIIYMIFLTIALSTLELVFSIYSAASLSRQCRKTFEVLRGIKQSEICLEVRKELQCFEIELLNDKIEIGPCNLFELSSSYGYLVRSSSLDFDSKFHVNFSLQMLAACLDFAITLVQFHLSQSSEN